MSEKSYWRGYVDAQSKTDYLSKKVIATARKPKMLQPLAEMIGSTVHPYRSGFYVPIKDLDKQLPRKLDDDYVKGFFDARGQRYKDPLRLTITSVNLNLFAETITKALKIELPKSQKPSKASDSFRVIITGHKAETVYKYLRTI